MMADIFSSFDPFTIKLIKSIPILSWIILIMFFPLLNSSFWVKPTALTNLVFNFKSTSYTLSSRSSMKDMNPMNWVMTSLFLSILTFNIMGLIPYSFSFSNHLFMTTAFALPFWLSMILSSFSFNFYNSTASMLPSGAPATLNPFLVLIESVSIMVRPLTLAFRLSANMTAGHVILGLMGAYLSSIILTPSFSTIIMIMLMSGYLIFELAICFIQAYVFCLLLSLYSNDHSQ